MKDRNTQGYHKKSNIYFKNKKNENQKKKYYQKVNNKNNNKVNYYKKNNKYYKKNKAKDKIINDITGVVNLKDEKEIENNINYDNIYDEFENQVSNIDYVNNINQDRNIDAISFDLEQDNIENETNLEKEIDNNNDNNININVNEYLDTSSINDKNNIIEQYEFEEPVLKKKEKIMEEKEVKSNNIKLKPVILYILGPILLIAIIIGTTYAYFNYYSVIDQEGDIVAGEVYVKLDGDTIDFNLSKYPRTTEEARSMNNNYFDFNILSKNTSETQAVIYYFSLENGESEESPKIRINPDYIRVDLSLVENNVETLLLDAVKLSNLSAYDLSATNNVPINTTSQVIKTYRLRAWVSDEVVISDTETHAYTMSQFNNLYANFKLKVSTSMISSSLPLVVDAKRSNIENDLSYVDATITNSYPLSEAGNALSTNDTVRVVVTDLNSSLYFNYTDSLENSVLTDETSIDKTYTFSRNESVNMRIYLKPQANNVTLVNTTLNFKVYKNNELVRDYNQLVSVVGNDNEGE